MHSTLWGQKAKGEDITQLQSACFVPHLSPDNICQQGHVWNPKKPTLPVLNNTDLDRNKSPILSKTASYSHSTSATRLKSLEIVQIRLRSKVEHLTNITFENHHWFETGRNIRKPSLTLETHHQISPSRLKREQRFIARKRDKFCTRTEKNFPIH